MKMKILIVDNYDSFTYNLVHYVEEIVSDKVDVFRNDEISIADVDQYDNADDLTGQLNVLSLSPFKK